MSARAATGGTQAGPAACAVAAALALGWAVQVDLGRATPLSLPLLALALVLLLRGAFRSAGPAAASGNSLFRPLALAGIGVNAVCQIVAAPGLYLTPGADALGHLKLTLLAAALGLGAVLAPWRMARRIFLPALLVVHALLAAWMLVGSPRPFIDVFVFHEQAADRLLEGGNPYRMSFPDIYGDQAPAYPAELRKDGRVLTGYPFPATSLYAVSAARMIAGDPRWAFAGAWLLAAAVLAFLGPRGPAAAALLLSLPRSLFVLEQGWTDPWVLLWVALVLLAARVRSPLLPVLFGLLLGSKHYALVLLPLGLFLAPPGPSRDRVRWWALVAGGFLVPALPFLLSSPVAYVGSVFGYPLRLAWRLDGLSLLGLLTRDPAGIGWAALLAAGAAMAWGWRRFGPGIGAFGAVGAAMLGGFFGLGGGTGCGELMLLAGLCLGWSALPPPGPRTATAHEPPAAGAAAVVRARPGLLLGLGLVLLALVLGWGWLRDDASSGEFLANLAKATDFSRGLALDGDFPWWTPSFNGGSSMAPVLGSFLTYLWLLLGTAVGGLFVGGKLAALAQIPLAGLAMFALARRITRCGWTAALAGLLYATAPQLNIALATREHMVVAFAMVWPPLVLLGLLRVRASGGWGDAALCAAAVGAMAFTWIKSAVALAPLLVLAAAWLWWSQPDARGRLLRGLLRVALLLVPLLGFPLLPLLRESLFMTLFSLDPFENWQRSFSLKAAVSWMDRAGLATRGMGGQFTVEEGRFYWGWIPLAVCFGGMLFRRSRAVLLGGPWSGWFRFCVLAAFVLQWLSLGPRNFARGMVEFLGSAQGGANWVIPFAWALFFAAPFALWHLLPFRRVAPRIAVLLAFLFVPGFVWLEKVPGFGNLRAPWAIWEAGGGLVLALGAALGGSVLVRAWVAPARRPLVAAGLAALVLVDAAAYHRAFFRWALPAGTFKDFAGAAAFLRDAPLPGRVNAVSGRYFYLLTPLLTGRGLQSEAFHGQFALRWQRRLERAGYEGPDALRMLHRAAGVAYVLVDKRDPDTPEDLQRTLREAFPEVAFENEHFVVLENADTLAPAWRAREYFALEPGSYFRAGEILSLARYAYLGVELIGDEASPPGAVGQGSAADGIRLSPAYKDKTGTPFERVSGVSRPDYRTVAITSKARPPGWVVLTESFHPDWTAELGSRQIPVRLAAGAFVAAWDPGGDEPLVFRFRPPAWYGWVLGLGFVAWGALVVRGGAAAAAWVRGRGLGRAETDAGGEFASRPSQAEEAGPLERPLVVVPTYNEAESIPAFLDRVLAVDPRLEVLVVDDGSPDGTAELVRGHASHGARVHVLERAGKLGLGTAYREGFQWALARGYDACVEMDADLSHDPADLPVLLRAAEAGADLAVGSRYLDGVRVVDWPIGRLLLSTGAGWYARGITGLPMTDPTSGFKVIRRRALERLDWSLFTSGGYSFQIELHYFAWRAGFRIRELPIVFTERRRGASKMSRAIAAEAAWRVVQLGVLGR